jgi:hypothetical protein
VILYPDELGDLGISLILGLLFLVGWILPRSRPAHGAVIIGISAAGSTETAVISISGGLSPAISHGAIAVAAMTSLWSM